MGDMLSQAEIDALLSGDELPPTDAALDGGAAGLATAGADSLAADGLSAEAGLDAGDMSEIANGLLDTDALLDTDVLPGSAGLPDSGGLAAPGGTPRVADAKDFIIGEDPGEDFTEEEIDALGEIGNISIGNSATTLFSLLNRKVSITTPRVSVSTLNEIAKNYSAPLVVVRVEYTEGLFGSNMLILKESDVMVITDLMLGGEGVDIQGDITDLHLSAISEAMNQMIGNASTSLSNVFSKKIDISPPSATSVKINDSNMLLQVINIEADEKVAVVSFGMVVENLLDTKIMQIQPVEFAKDMIVKLMEANKQSSDAPADIAASASASTPPLAAAQAPTPMPMPLSMPSPAQPPNAPYPMTADGMPYPQAAQPPYPQMPPQMPPQYAQAPPPYPQAPPQYAPPNRYVNVQPASFNTFDDGSFVVDKKNIGLVMDVNLEVSVELGRTHKLIRDILEFGQGTIIELDKLAGEPVDILVNGKTIAVGEVVVIDESFGVRVADIIHPSKRI